jgi:sugar lactone lactonase YvrE
MSWQAITTTPCELGESPFWHPHEQMLYWVDIPGKKIQRANVYLGTVDTWDLPSEPGCIAPAANGGLVMALRHGVFRARTWGGPLQHIATLDYDASRMRANDGKCDALGRFWVGTIDESRQAHDAALYCLDGRGGGTVTVSRKAGPATTANGLALSPDGRTLYWADTPAHVVWAWDVEPAANSLSAQRTFHQFPPKPDGWQFEQSNYQGRPDGAAVDVDGNYWVAMFEGRRLCQFAADGRLLAEVPTPLQCPTMPCFGGDDLRTLYLTSARYKRSPAELQAFPLSGCVLTMRVEVAGLPVNFYAD